MHCNSKNLRMNVKKHTFLFFCCSVYDILWPQLETLVGIAKKKGDLIRFSKGVFAAYLRLRLKLLAATTCGQCVTVGAMGCVVVETYILVLWRSGHARSESFKSQDTSDQSKSINRARKWF